MFGFFFFCARAQNSVTRHANAAVPNNDDRPISATNIGSKDVVVVLTVYKMGYTARLKGKSTTSLVTIIHVASVHVLSKAIKEPNC